MSEVEQETLFEFPCQFPIKAMGRNIPDLEVIVVEMIRRHAPDLTEADVKTRASKSGKFIAVTIHVEAQSKAQLDAIYMDLTACPEIMMTL